MTARLSISAARTDVASPAMAPALLSPPQSLSPSLPPQVPAVRGAARWLRPRCCHRRCSRHRSPKGAFTDVPPRCWNIMWKVSSALRKASSWRICCMTVCVPRDSVNASMARRMQIAMSIDKSYPQGSVLAADC